MTHDQFFKQLEAEDWSIYRYDITDAMSEATSRSATIMYDTELVQHREYDGGWGPLWLMTGWGDEYELEDKLKELTK